MYIFLYILAGLTVLILAASFIPISLNLKFEDSKFNSKLKFLGITLNPKMFNKKDGKGKDSEENKNEDKKEKKKPSLEKIKEGINTARDIVKRLPYRVVVKDFHIRLTIVGEDAAQTAIEYGGACAVVFGFIGYIQNFCFMKDPDVLITPGFDEKEEQFEFSCIIYTRLGNIILALLRFLVYSIKERIRNK